MSVRDEFMGEAPVNDGAYTYMMYT
jgi:hypothetical protein